MNYRVLILTDHRNHSAQNSLYSLAEKMLLHPKTKSIDVASRMNSLNDSFFSCSKDSKLYATTVTSDFKFSSEAHPLSQDYNEIDFKSYDLIWLRMPPPLGKGFLKFIDAIFQEAIVINDPKHIYETGSKEFLVNFSSVCPPMKVCNSLSDIIEFKKLYPIVLKPFNEYGGKGIVKIVDNEVSSGNERISFEEFAKAYAHNPIDYLAVKFLKNVEQGDKRIVVVNGEIMGASLRLPAKESWICNVSMGGSFNKTEIEPEEKEIINLVDPVLSEKGIVMYGVDTLVGDDGKRVLSEINTTSIGGLPQIAAMDKKPVVQRSIDLIWGYYDEKMKVNG